MSKLIVIDDNSTDHYIMKRLLQKNNSCDSATFAYDGSLVLEYLEENRYHTSKIPDVIFLDLDMPGTNGWEFLDKLEKLPAMVRKKIRVNIMSSSVRSADIFNSKKYACVNAYLVKPLSSDTLKQACRAGN